MSLTNATANTQPAPEVGRLAGVDRIETAVAISRHEFVNGASTVYLARADVPADAVAGGSLTGGPILLVPTCLPLPQIVRAEIARLEPDRIWALGGPGAICDELLEVVDDPIGAPPPPPGATPGPTPEPNPAEPDDFLVAIGAVAASGEAALGSDGEYVDLTNEDDSARSVAGWYLLDVEGNYIGMPEGFSIGAGGALRIYTGMGESSESVFYAGRSDMIEPGDELRLYHSGGELIDSFAV